MQLSMLILCGAVFLAEDKPANAADEDQKSIQGTWELVGVEKFGKREAVKKGTTTIVITGNRILDKSTPPSFPQDFRLDPKKTPKAIDILVRGVIGNQGMGPIPITHTDLGIYELNGDDLKIMTKADGRPKEFNTGKEGGEILFYKRIKK